MNLVFTDQQFSYQLLRVLSNAAWGGSDIGECLSTASRIKEGDFESWCVEWNRTAERLHAWADECLRVGQRVSAGQAYLRASHYYRTAEFYLHGCPSDSRIREFSRHSLFCFGEALRLSGRPVEAVRIPYEGTTLPGYFYHAEAQPSARPRPTLLRQTGFDGTGEEMHGSALAAAVRGWNCLVFEGPGQGRVIREQGLPFRPDWEKVVTPVVDYALSRTEVDPRKVALMGLSFGGYLAPRAAAFEHRLAALVANGGVFDFFANAVPPGMTRQDAIEYMKRFPEQINTGLGQLMQTNLDTRWAVENGMFAFHATSPVEWSLQTTEYTMDGVAQNITCPTLIVDSENERTFKGQARRLYDALTCPKEFMLFTADEGAGEHCQMGAAFFSDERIFAWLEKTLAT
jgi:pimeloyl-ACP methyl ester carboxylesterase